jgi:hypothetical protein
MPIHANALRAVILCFPMLVATGLHAEGIDTEHLFGFMIGTDVGEQGEREFQSQTTGRFSKDGGSYRAISQELELEFVPANNFRIELGSTFTLHDIVGVPGLADASQLAWQGASLDLRYKFLDRDAAPFGLTFAIETHANRIDETTAALARNYGNELTLAFDRELVAGFVMAGLNLLYQPEWTHFAVSATAEQEATVGAAFSAMAQVRPGLFLGGEARYLRKYEGIGLDAFAGQAVFVGPTVYIKLSDRARLTATWSVQAWGQAAGSPGTLDLVDFERHQARLIFGVNF